MFTVIVTVTLPEPTLPPPSFRSQTTCLDDSGEARQGQSGDSYPIPKAGIGSSPRFAAPFCVSSFVAGYRTNSSARLNSGSNSVRPPAALALRTAASAPGGPQTRVSNAG